MTREEIITRLKGNGTPSIFESAILKYIEELEEKVNVLQYELELEIDKSWRDCEY